MLRPSRLHMCHMPITVPCMRHSSTPWTPALDAPRRARSPPSVSPASTLGPQHTRPLTSPSLTHSPSLFFPPPPRRTSTKQPSRPPSTRLVPHSRLIISHLNRLGLFSLAFFSRIIPQSLRSQSSQYEGCIVDGSCAARLRPGWRSSQTQAQEGPSC